MNDTAQAPAAEPKQMNDRDALRVLDEVTGRIQLSRGDHVVVQNALLRLAVLVAAEEKRAEAAAADVISKVPFEHPMRTKKAKAG
jgi:hypothetical protein